MSLVPLAGAATMFVVLPALAVLIAAMFVATMYAAVAADLREGRTERRIF